MTEALYQIARRQIRRIRFIRPADRDDVIQETFLRLVESGARIDADANPEGFVFHALRRTALVRAQEEIRDRGEAAGKVGAATSKPSRRRSREAYAALLASVEERVPFGAFSVDRFVAHLGASIAENFPAGRYPARSVEIVANLIARGGVDAIDETAAHFGISKVSIRSAVSRLATYIRGAVAAGVLE